MEGRRRRSTFRSAAPKMEDQQDSSTDDQTLGADDVRSEGADARRPEVLRRRWRTGADARRSEVQRRRWRTSMCRRLTIGSTAPKMKDQHAPTPDDLMHCAEDGGSAGADARRPEARRRRWSTSRRRRPTIRGTAPKIDELPDTRRPVIRRRKRRCSRASTRRLR